MSLQIEWQRMIHFMTNFSGTYNSFLSSNVQFMFDTSWKYIQSKCTFCSRYFNSDSWGHNFEKREVICKMVSSVYIDERKCDEIMG